MKKESIEHLITKRRMLERHMALGKLSASLNNNTVKYHVFYTWQSIISLRRKMFIRTPCKSMRSDKAFCHVLCQN